MRAEDCSPVLSTSSSTLSITTQDSVHVDIDFKAAARRTEDL